MPVVLIGIALLWVVVVLLLQRRILYPRHLVEADLPGAQVEGLQKLWIESPQGPVEAWFLPPDTAGPSAAAPAVLFAHGNGELIDFWPTLMRPYRQMGLAVLLVEYRGYGRSAGSPSQHAITEDVIRFFDRLQARPDVDAQRIVLHGRSLGGGAVCALVSHRPAAALILESTFTSVAALAWRSAVPPLLVLDKFDNLGVLEQLDVPVLILHGRHDRIIPVRHAERLHAAAGPSQLKLYEAGHNDGLAGGGAYWHDIRIFLEGTGIVP